MVASTYTMFASVDVMCPEQDELDGVWEGSMGGLLLLEPKEGLDVVLSGPQGMSAGQQGVAARCATLGVLPE